MEKKNILIKIGITFLYILSGIIGCFFGHVLLYIIQLPIHDQYMAWIDSTKEAYKFILGYGFWYIGATTTIFLINLAAKQFKYRYIPIISALSLFLMYLFILSIQDWWFLN